MSTPRSYEAVQVKKRRSISSEVRSIRSQVVTSTGAKSADRGASSEVVQITGPAVQGALITIPAPNPTNGRINPKRTVPFTSERKLRNVSLCGQPHVNGAPIP